MRKVSPPLCSVSFLLEIIACKEIVFDLENHNGSRGGRRSGASVGGWFSNHFPLLGFLDFC